MHDEACEVACRNPNMMVPWWIMAAWAYDKGERPILSDSCFDALATRLDIEWKMVEHRHKKLLDRKMLKSAIAIRGKWPALAISAAQRLMVTPPECVKITPTNKHGQGLLL